MMERGKGSDRKRWGENLPMVPMVIARPRTSVPIFLRIVMMVVGVKPIHVIFVYNNNRDWVDWCLIDF